MKKTYNRNHNIISSAISVFLVLLSFLFLFGFWTPASASATNGARSYLERLPIQYEEWFDKVHGGVTRKNYVYKDFLFPPRVYLHRNQNKDRPDSLGTRIL